MPAAGAPRHRDPVFERDGWRCAAPGCSSRSNLHDHHIIFRSHRHDDSRDNRISVYAWHHLRGIHAGTFRVTGRVSRGLVWEIGLRGDKRPLMRCVRDTHETVIADRLDTDFEIHTRAVA